VQRQALSKQYPDVMKYYDEEEDEDTPGAKAPARLKEYEAKSDAFRKQIAARMGALPPEKAKTGHELNSIKYGSIRHENLMIGMQYVNFTAPSIGLPAVADWLYQHGCTDLRYGFGREYGRGED